jgi:hypothetical protein
VGERDIGGDTRATEGVGVASNGGEEEEEEEEEVDLLERDPFDREEDEEAEEEGAGTGGVWCW